ncbi:MAG: MoxR family ATPase [Pseudomonadota bacterium]
MSDSKQAIERLKAHVSRHIVGQDALVQRLIIALLCDGHLLVEGAPGLAKTRAIKILAEGIEGDFHRIQFTPDLLPADLTGTDIFRPQDGSFVFQEGPLFHNVVLADEVNRAPAKVQSALLEAMGERQITVGKTTYPLPQLFLVMATQNPIEQEGTYPLPEAQLDRFLLYVKVDSPGGEEEREILHLVRGESLAASKGTVAEAPRISQQHILMARREVLELHMSENIENYLLELVLATRSPKTYGEDFDNVLTYGASPRATIGLDRAARAHAWLNGRDYVGPEDVQAMIPDVMRHRIQLTYEALADGKTPDGFIDELMSRIAVP